MEGKKWYLSKTTWGLIISFTAFLLKSTGLFDISEADQALLVDQILRLAVDITELVGMAIAFYGRLVASKPLTM